MTSALPPTDWLRLLLIYLHLLSCAFALVLVLGADWRIATRRFTADGLRRTASRTSVALGALWLTGLALIHRDTGFDPVLMIESPKLLLKLLVVVTLTANGFFLHAVSFPLIVQSRRPGVAGSMLLATTGALSTGHWLLAAFVGVARPLGTWSFQHLLNGYALYCGVTLVAGLMCTSELRRRLPARRSTRVRHGHLASAGSP